MFLSCKLYLAIIKSDDIICIIICYFHTQYNGYEKLNNYYCFIQFKYEISIFLKVKSVN